MRSLHQKEIIITSGGEINRDDVTFYTTMFSTIFGTIATLTYLNATGSLEKRFVDTALLPFGVMIFFASMGGCASEIINQIFLD